MRLNVYMMPGFSMYDDVNCSILRGDGSQVVNILLTGPPRVGKTTLILNILSELNAIFPTLDRYGFYTQELLSKDKKQRGRVGFGITTLDGQQGTLAHVDLRRSSRYHVGKYGIDLRTFELLALEQLKKVCCVVGGEAEGEGGSIDHSPCIVIIDEIG